MASSSPLRVGILGTANIARQFTRDVASSGALEVTTVASRQADTAAAFAQANGIARHHGSYEALLADEAIDAIYLPLPNSMHATWAIRAAQHGKHVLCEKPLALRLDEARAMFEAASRNAVIVFESFPYEWQPSLRALVQLLESGGIGEVRSMQAGFCFTVPNPDTNIRLKPDLGGGALLDAGSYPLSLIRVVMGRPPQRVRADPTWHPGGVDIAMMATLHYDDGRRAQLSCAMNAAYHRYAAIDGSLGAIETDYLNHTSDEAQGDARGYVPGRLRVRRGIPVTTRWEDLAAPTGSGFLFAAEAFARLVTERDFAAADRAAQASLDNAATLEAIARSARTGSTVDVLGRT